MSHYWKNRVNKWLYGNSKRNTSYTNANMKAPKELLQLPLVDIEDVRRKIEFVLHVPDLYKELGISDDVERWICIVWHEPRDIPETIEKFDHMWPILIIGAWIHDRKIVDDVIIKDLKMLLAQLNGDMRKRALEVLNKKK